MMDSIPLPPSPPRAHGRSTPVPAEPVEFRGFDFFAQRDFNQMKDASRVYFGGGATAGGKEEGATWLGDATPPGTGTHPSFDSDVAPRPGTFPIPPGGKTPRGGMEQRILGLRKPIFWTLVAVIVLIIIIAIGVGAGVGASQNSGSKGAVGSGSTSSSMTPTQSVASQTSDPTPTASSTPNSPWTPTSSSSSMQPTTPGVMDTGCPGMNNTIYTVPGTTAHYKILCGVDYSGDGTVDIKHLPTVNETTCIANCVGTPTCTGCAWGYIEGGPTSDFVCYLKRNLRVPHTADPAWVFAVFQP